ncbi:hypothetical protein ACFX14_005986 [Malus domestica]
MVRVDGFCRSGQASAILCLTVVQADCEMNRQHQQQVCGSMRWWESISDNNNRRQAQRGSSASRLWRLSFRPVRLRLQHSNKFQRLPLLTIFYYKCPIFCV